MQSFPPGPQFQVAPSWLGLVVVLAAGLAFLAFIAVLTAVLATGKPIVPMQRIKGFVTMMLLIVPALAVVGVIGMKFGTARVHTYTYQGSPGQVPEARDHESARAARAANRAASQQTGRGQVRSEPVRDVDGKLVRVALTAEREVTDSSSRAASTNSADEEAADNPRAVLSAARPLTGVLKVRGTASAPPDWAGKDPVPGTDGVLVALSSQRFATLGEAEEQVTRLAVDYVRKFYHDEYPLRGDWTVPVSVIEQNGLNAIVGEMFDKDFGNGVTGMMYRAHLRLDMNPALRKALHASWDEQIVNRRLMELGGALGLATLILATCAGYFRLDAWTGGKYRRRLKLAAASLFAAGSLVTSVCVLLA